MSDENLRKRFVCVDCQESTDSENESEDEDAVTDDKNSQSHGLLSSVLSKIGGLEKKLDRKLNQFQAIIDMCSRGQPP